MLPLTVSEVDVVLFRRLPVKPLFVLILSGRPHACTGLGCELGPRPRPMSPKGQKDIFWARGKVTGTRCDSMEVKGINSFFIPQVFIGLQQQGAWRAGQIRRPPWGVWGLRHPEPAIPRWEVKLGAFGPSLSPQTLVLALPIKVSPWICF